MAQQHHRGRGCFAMDGASRGPRQVTSRSMTASRSGPSGSQRAATTNANGVWEARVLGGEHACALARRRSVRTTLHPRRGSCRTARRPGSSMRSTEQVGREGQLVELPGDRQLDRRVATGHGVAARSHGIHQRCRTEPLEDLANDSPAAVGVVDRPWSDSDESSYAGRSRPAAGSGRVQIPDAGLSPFGGAGMAGTAPTALLSRSRNAPSS